MADILPFKKVKTGARPKGLCQHGFHRWEICKNTQFDVRKGKLVTLYRCQRCGVTKVDAT